jgi:hypothetical protein
MFGFEIPFGFALLLIVIYLIDKLLTKIVDGIEHAHQRNKERRGQKVFDLYQKLQRLSPEEREAFLNNQPSSVKKCFEKGVSLWGEPD